MISTVDRRNEIVRLINENRKVKVEELSTQFKVSSVTIRNDLKYLEDQGIIHRVYGGALVRDTVSRDSSFIEKAKLHATEKGRIGARAAEMIFDGDSIIIDSGTTTIEIARRIKDRQNITVMTNDVNIATELAGNSGISLHMPGGLVRENSFSLVGPAAEAALREYYFDKLFLGVDGFDMNVGLTTPNQMEAKLNTLMVEVARETILVTDSSKFGRKTLCRICGPDAIKRIITDGNITQDYLDGFAEMGIEVTIA